MPIEIKELQIRVQVPEPNEETALGSPVQIHVDASDNIWIGPGETTPDDLFGTDAGVPDHDSWIDVDATIQGGHKSGSDAAPGGRLFLATEVGVYAGGGLNDWRSNYGTGGGAAASDGGGDDILIGGDSANGGLSHGKASFQDLSVIIPASDGGLGINTVLLDGSIRTVGPQDAGETSAPEASGPMKESMETMKKAWMDASATPEGSPVTERTSGLTYSGESGGLNEAQTGHYSQSYSWGLDRIDMLDDVAAPFFAYDAGFRGGVDVSGIHHTGALRNVSGDAMPAAAGDNMQTYLEIELTDALLSSYASGKASEDDFAAAPADTGNPLGNTYTGMTAINDGVLQHDMTLSFSYDLV